MFDAYRMWPSTHLRPPPKQAEVADHFAMYLFAALPHAEGNVFRVERVCVYGFILVSFLPTQGYRKQGLMFT